MRKSVLKLLPLAAVVLIATSCSKDDNKDNNEVVNPENQEVVGTKTVPMTITVGKKSKPLSKATITDATSLVQIFEAGDKLSVATSDGGIWGTLDPVTFGENSTSATFSGQVELKENAELVVGKTSLNAKLITANNSKGEKIKEVQADATSLKEAFQKYGCWQTSGSFTYNGSSTDVELVEQTAFIEILLHKSIQNVTVTIKYGESTVYSNSSISGNTYLAVPDGCTVSSSLFSGTKTIDVSTDKVVYTVDLSQFVDLGTGDKVLWATCNIGAENPWDYGDYYAWGETTTKNDYSWSTYAYGRAKEGEETHAMVNKYCPSTQSDYWYYDGETATTPDGKSTLLSGDNIAHMKNGNWSMPTNTYFKNLRTKCDWVWTTNYKNSSVKGYIVYKKKDNSKYNLATDTHIFLPAAGYFNGTTHHINGSKGRYWSSNLYQDEPINAEGLEITSNSKSQSICLRCLGLSVRPIWRKK